MPQKKGGKSKGFVSQGLYSNVSKKTRNALKQSYRDRADMMLNKLKAFKQGKPVNITIPNPNPQETNKPYIKQKWK